MSFKEKIQISINIYTRVVCGIFLLNCLYLIWLPGNPSLKISDIIGIQLIGLISAIANIPFLIEKEYSKVALGILNVAYFLVVNISVLVLGYLMGWFSFRIKGSLIGVEIMIIAVYALTKGIFYIIDFNSASKLTKKLKERNGE